MAVKITTLDEAIEDNGLKIAVHGPAGIGKTVLAATTKAPTLIVSAESGLLSLKTAPAGIKKNLRIATVRNINEVKEILTGLEQDQMGCEWIVLDSASEIAEQCLSAEKKFSSDPRQAYGKLIEEMTIIFKAFRDLPKVNVLMTFKQSRSKDEHTGVSSYVPRMPGQSLGVDVPYLFDELFAFVIVTDEDNNEVRMLQTRRDIQYEAKDRSGLLRKYEPANLKHISDVIHGKVKVDIDELPEHDATQPEEVTEPDTDKEDNVKVLKQDTK